MITSKELGKKFSEKRQELGYSVEEVCLKTRIHRTVILDIEAGVFDKLSKLYLKSFLEKYSLFLGLNTEKVLNEYRAVSDIIPEEDFTFEVKEKEEKIRPEIKINIDEKTVKKIIIAAGAVLVLYIFFSVVGMIKTKVAEARKNAPAKKIVKIETPKKEIKETPVQEIKIEPAITNFVEPERSQDVELVLKATGEVWIHITDEQEKVLYSGTLNRGDKKTIDSKGTINVWTGKAEALEVMVNSEDLGRIASGVIKDIKISSEKITIDEEIILKLR